MGRNVWRRGGALVLALLASASLAACATSRPSRTVDNRPAAKPGARVPGTMRPYQVKGVWYKPREQPDYNEVGLASWYGQQFHNRQTANGEMFDMWVVSAAHKTLPLPSIVEVTNLDNGKKIKVRVNDRGPFVSGRIIDMSRAGADALGFSGKGTARVRVRYIGPAPARGKDRTLQYAGLARDEEPRALSVPRGDDWLVQAGAFAERGNAEKAVHSLRDVGRAKIVPSKRDGRTLYRVVIESGRDVAGAGRLRDQVAMAGFPDAKLIAER